MGLLGISTNLPAISAHRALAVANGYLRTSIERLSSGLRINRAADDAAGLALSEGLRSEIRGTAQAVRNAQDAVNVLQVADGVLGSTGAILQRMRDLAVQGANSGALDDVAFQAVRRELTQLRTELTRIAGTAAGSGSRLLDGTYRGVFQVGASVGDTIRVDVTSAFDARGLGVGGLDLGRIGAPAVGVTPAQGRADVLRPGQLVFVGATGSDAALQALTGTVRLSGVDLDLGAVIGAALAVTPGAGRSQLVAALNAAAAAAGITHQPDPFLDDGDDLILRGPVPSASASPADLADASPVSTVVPPPAGLVAVPATLSDGPRAGLLTFPGRTRADITGLGGTITVGDRSLDLGSIVYVDTDGDGLVDGDEALAQLDAAAKAAGITPDDHSFSDAASVVVSPDSHGTVDGVLTFRGPVPAATATPAELLAATPVFTPTPPPLTAIDEAIRRVGAQRAELGALQNRVEHTVDRLRVALENATAAESRIRDADMAQEAVRLTRGQILSQSGAAMLAQAHRAPQALLVLLG
ncbi:flagellin N-terminal helical domain-containing protein [Blastococcus sp. SYSU D00695]